MLKVSAEQGKVKPVARGEQAAWEWLRGGRAELCRASWKKPEDVFRESAAAAAARRRDPFGEQSSFWLSKPASSLVYVKSFCTFFFFS